MKRNLVNFTRGSQLLADSEASRAVFRIEAARDSDLIARGIPRIVRAAFRFDGAQFEVRAA
jgi:hypothetical protein